MDFKEWFKTEYPEINKDADDLILGARPMRYMAEMGYKAGQQSKQEKIDEALAEISRAMKCCESIETECVLTEIKELLK